MELSPNFRIDVWEHNLEIEKTNEPAHDKTYTKICAPEKTQISLYIRAVWSVFADQMYLYSLLAIQKGINKNPCHTENIYRLIWVFAGHTSRFL